MRPCLKRGAQVGLVKFCHRLIPLLMMNRRRHSSRCGPQDKVKGVVPDDAQDGDTLQEPSLTVLISFIVAYIRTAVPQAPKDRPRAVAEINLGRGIDAPSPSARSMIVLARCTAWIKL